MSPRQITLSIAAALLAACATTAPPAGSMPPVKVVVTAVPAVRDYVLADKLTEATEEALRRFAPDAGPSTITLHFASLAAVDDGNSHIDVRAEPGATMPTGHSFPIISTEPWNEGVRQRATVTEVPTSRGMVRTAVRGTYTITDASGTVLEQKTVYIGLHYLDAPQERLLGEQRRTAEYLARRVAKLTGQHG